MKAMITLIMATLIPASASMARDGYAYGPAWAELDVQSAGQGCGDVYMVSPTHLVIYGSDLEVDTSYRRFDREQCSYILDIEAEQGWAYSVAGIYTEVDADIYGGRAVFSFSSYFQGSRGTDSVSKTLTRSGLTTVAGAIYGEASDCYKDRALIAKTSLNARGSGYRGGAAASLAGPVHVFLDWNTCY